MNLSLWRRQASATPGTSVLIVIIVLIGTAVLAAWPRLLERTYIDEVQYQLTSTSAVQQAAISTFVTTDYPPTDPEAALEVMDGLVADAEPDLAPLLGSPRISLTSLESAVVDMPRGLPADLATTEVRFRVDPDIEAEVDVVEGELPGGGNTEDGVDLMMSVDSAERLGLQVGDEFTYGGVEYAGIPPWTFRLTGTFEPKDAASVQWSHQLSTIEPLVQYDPDIGSMATAIGYLHLDNADVVSLLGSVEGRAWIPINPAATDATELLSQLRTFTAGEHVLDPDNGTNKVRFDSPLIDVLQGAIDRWRGTSTVLSMLAAGPIGVLIAVIGQSVQLVVTRRKDTLALVSARGGSGWQVRGALALEGLVLALPAAAIGIAGALLLIPGPVRLSELVTPALVALAPAVFLASTRLPSLRSTRADLGSRASSQWRVVGEILVLGAAGASVYFLFSRGLVASEGTDPLSVAAPLLLALLTAIVAMRFFGLPLRAAHRATKRSAGLSGFLGSARALREGRAPFVTLLALVAGISVAVFSTVMITTMREGVIDASLSEAGGDLRLSGPTLNEEQVEQIAGIDEITAVSPVSTMASVPLAGERGSSRVTVYAVDTEVLREIQSEVPDAVQLPAGMHAMDGDRLPALVSSSLELSGQPRLQMRNSLDLEVLGSADSAPGVVGPTDGWVLVDVHLLREHADLVLPPRVLLMSVAQGADPDAVSAQVLAVTENAGTVTYPEQNLQDFLASPSNASIERSFIAALVLSTGLSALAVVLTLVLSAPARGRLVAVLRTLGAPGKLTRRIVAWEAFPAVGVSLFFGTALGCVLPLLVANTTDLRAFTGGAQAPELQYPILAILAVAGGTGLLLSGCVLLASMIAQRLSLSALRIGDPQ